jgi:hypothetical protein
MLRRRMALCSVMLSTSRVRVPQTWMWSLFLSTHNLVPLLVVSPASILLRQCLHFLQATRLALLPSFTTMVLFFISGMTNGKSRAREAPTHSMRARISAISSRYSNH